MLFSIMFISIDFSSASQKINSVNIPAEMFKAIGRAGQNGNNAAARLSIALAMGIVEFDGISLDSISNASGNGSIKILIDEALFFDWVESRKEDSHVE